MSHKIECRLNAVNVILSRETETKQKAKIVEATSHTNANEQPELIAQHTIGCARVCRLILSFAQLHWPVTTIVGSTIHWTYPGLHNAHHTCSQIARVENEKP